MAYRPLEPPVDLRHAWQREDRRHLFLYVHLPFCEMRCGFCNLFTTVQPGTGLVAETLAAIQRQSTEVKEAVVPGAVAQAAFGGGTPSFLGLAELSDLLNHLERVWPMHFSTIPVSFEVSPGTISRDKLEFLKARGIDRISMGIRTGIMPGQRASD